MANCYGSIQACMLRWAVVNEAGQPQPGASNGYQSDALIQVGVGVELEAGADVSQKNGCGALCQAFRQPDLIKRVTLEIPLCQLDAELIQLAVGGTVITSGGLAIGYELPTLSDTPNPGGVLEVWTYAWDGESQAALAGAARYFHFVFPHARFSPGNFTLEAPNFLQFPLVGYSDANPNVTINGPYNDWPAAVVAIGGITASAGWFLDTTIPTAACGYQTVPGPAS